MKGKNQYIILSAFIISLVLAFLCRQFHCNIFLFITLTALLIFMTGWVIIKKC